MRRTNKNEQINTKNKFKQLKNLSHFIKRNFTKGSKKEVETKLKLENPAPYVEQILQLKYFECNVEMILIQIYIKPIMQKLIYFKLTKDKRIITMIV